MSAIGKGDRVQCIAADRAGTIEVGDFYTVEGLGDAPLFCRCWRCDSADAGAVFLTHPGAAWRGYCPCHFRPAGRRKSTFIESLKSPAPDAVRELVAAD